MTDITCKIEEIEKLEKEKGRRFDYIKLSFVDLNGIVESKIVQRCFIEDILSEGIENYAGDKSILFRIFYDCN